MIKKTSHWLYVTVAFLFLSPHQSTLAARGSQLEISIFGQVREPQTLTMPTPLDIISAINKAGGPTNLADVSNVKIIFDREQSAVRHLTIDLEQLVESDLAFNLSHVTAIQIPEIRVIFPGTPSYEKANKLFKLSASEARAKIPATALTQTNDTVPKKPTMIVGRYYWFATEESSHPQHSGWYVDGTTGEVREYYRNRDQFPKR